MMTDTLSPDARSQLMSGIKSKDTKPEMMVRSLLHRLGYRYRLHGVDLPGKPDLVFASRRKIVFVHGCFWHYHAGCDIAHVPISNRDYWLPKLTRTKLRDERNCALLKRAGWAVTTVWECQLRDLAATAERLVEFLESQVPG